MPTFLQTWLPFIYLYGVGGFFFLLGMVLIRKSKAIDMTKKKHRFWYKVLILGFIYFVLLHATFIILALYW